jgi:hypothetical protein
MENFIVVVVAVAVIGGIAFAVARKRKSASGRVGGRAGHDDRKPQ